MENKTQMKEMIIAARADGFGERMLAILNAIYISKTLNLKFGYVWLRLPKENNKYENLLMSQANLCNEEELFEKSFIDSFSYTKKYNFIPTDGVGLFLRHEKYSLKKLLTYPKPYNFGYISTQYDLSKICNDVEPDEYYSSLIEIWNSIPFVTRIKQIIYDVSKDDLSNKNFIALHIRAGDIVFQERLHFIYDGREKALSTHLALEVISKELLNGNYIYLFGDDTDNLKIIKEYCCENFLQIKNKNKLLVIDEIVKQKGLTGIERNIYEICLMSKAKKIYASGKSGFSNLAHILSVRQNFISVYKFFTDEEKYNIIQKYLPKITNIHNFHKAFSYFHLYLLADKMKMSSDIKKIHLKKALECDPDNLTYHFFIMQTLFEEQKIDEVEFYLGKLFFENNVEHLLCFMLNYSPYDYGFMYSKLLIYCAKYAKFSFPFMMYVVFRVNLRMTQISSIFFREIPRNDDIYEKIKILSQYYQIASQFKTIDQNKEIIPRIGATKKVKEHLSYQFGVVIVKSKNLSDIIKLPFRLLKIKTQYSQKQKFLRMINLSDLENKDLPLEKYDDYQEALKIKNYLTYRLGNTLVKHPITFIFRAYGVYKKWRKERICR